MRKTQRGHFDLTVFYYLVGAIGAALSVAGVMLLWFAVRGLWL